MTIPSARHQLPTFYEQGKALTIRAPGWYVDQALTAPDSATYTLYDADGGVVIATKAAPVVSSLATVAIAASDFDAHEAPEEGWREVWALSVSGVVETVERDAYLCRRAPVMSITQDDLYAIHSNFKSWIPANQTTWQPQLEQGWVELVTLLISDRLVPGRLLNQWVLNRAHLYRTAAIACRDFSESVPNYLELAQDYERKAEEWYSKVALRNDHDDDGVTDTSDLVMADPQTFLTDFPDTVLSDGGYYL